MRALAIGIAIVSLGCGAASSGAAPAGRVASAGPHDPCDGAELDLGEASQRCRVEGAPADPPPPDRVSIAIATRSIATGADGVIAIAFRNEGEEAVELDFPGTLRFDASLWNGEQRVDERWQISGLSAGSATCRPGADCRTVRVRLAPRATLTASVPFRARVEILRDGPSRGSIERSDGGAIPPGEYRARVMLPWTDPVAGSATGARTPRLVEGPLSVTP